MSDADTLIAVSTLMLEAASREDWPSVIALDGERRSLIEALPATLDAVSAARLRSFDQQLLSMAGAERARLSERIVVGQQLDRAAQQYAVAARPPLNGSNGVS